MRIALYRGKSWVSRLIQWQTRSPYSHAALLLDSGRVIESWWRGGCGKHPDLGTVHTPGTPVDIFVIEDLPPELSALVCAAAHSYLGHRYDWLGVARFISRRPHHPRRRIFCSALVAQAFEAAGMPLLQRVPPSHLSPRDISLSPLLTYQTTHHTRRP